MEFKWNYSNGRASCWIGDIEIVAEKGDGDSYYWDVRWFSGEGFESCDAAKSSAETAVRSMIRAATESEHARIVDETREAERAACAARLEESARLLDGFAAECIAGSESRRIYETQAATVRAAIHAIRARSKTGT